MTKVIYNMSASLDGFVRASGATPGQPLGVGGDRVHQWFFDKEPANQAFVEKMLSSLGAVVSGRSTYDASAWGCDGPTGRLRVPVVVLTHNPPASPVQGGVYTFVTEGIAVAIHKARTLAGTKNVSLMGGPNVGRQALTAGLVDEIVVSVVPVLFGSGLAMFSELPSHLDLELMDVVRSRFATHLAYRVLK